MTTSTPRRPTRTLASCAVALGVVLALAACTTESREPVAAAGTTSTTATSPTRASSPSGGISPILPVATNPMTSNGSNEVLVIESVLVENNVLPSGDDASDHLEVALLNTGSQPLVGVEVFYTFSDPKTGDRESYYMRLPDSFSIAPGARRVAHFDGATGTDHFPVNKFSLYYTDTNALDVTVQAGSPDAATVTGEATKDAGGAEEAD